MNLLQVCIPVPRLQTFVFWMFLVTTSLLADEGGQAAKTLRLAVIYVEEPPFVYTTSNSEYRGIIPELAQALSRELNLELEYLPMPRKGLEQSLLNGKADVTWLSPEWVTNKEQLIFSDPVFMYREFLYSLNPFNESGNPLDWLRDKTICLREDYQYPSLDRFFVDNVARAVKVSSQVALVTLLLKKRCDLLNMNEHRAIWEINSLGIKRKVWRSSKPLEETELTFVFNKTWQTKMAQVNQVLSEIKRSGELGAIIQTNIHLSLLPNPKSTKFD
jgi:polar amino acid transport system substrate-binding protein